MKSRSLASTKLLLAVPSIVPAVSRQKARQQLLNPRHSVPLRAAGPGVTHTPDAHRVGGRFTRNLLSVRSWDFQ